MMSPDYLLDQPEDCPSTFTGFRKPVSKMGNYSLNTLAGHLIVTENLQNLGIHWLESIDDFREGECEDLRCDYRVRLVNSTLVEIGLPEHPGADIPTNSGSRVTIELDSTPSVALQHLKPIREKSGEKGHRWSHIDDALNSEPQDDKANVIIAINHDRDGFSNTERGFPHETLSEWEDDEIIPSGWSIRAVEGTIRPEDVLRHFGIPTVILADHVPSIIGAERIIPYDESEHSV
ncbi:hypothetical protein JCM30237_05910 [Halolamina litorea]|uniref:Uncharacterized protein n=1 Tax=Halolamina litorea TaxID=1515593 RepID=A0ABD6BPH4_9EURY|nr:hypothetical protein [Halolamina litorea]